MIRLLIERGDTDRSYTANGICLNKFHKTLYEIAVRSFQYGNPGLIVVQRAPFEGWLSRQ